MVKWTDSAKRALKQIHDYIALDSYHYAKTVAMDITNIAELLDSQPYRGRMVPEIKRKSIREVFAYSYRIIYKVTKTETLILLLLHQQQKLKPKLLFSKN